MNDFVELPKSLPISAVKSAWKRLLGAGVESGYDEVRVMYAEIVAQCGHEDGSGSKQEWKDYANLKFNQLSLAEQALHAIHSVVTKNGPTSEILSIYSRYFIDTNVLADAKP